MSDVSVGELLIRLILSLGVVIGVMAAAANLMRRMQSGGLNRRKPGKPMRVEILSRQQLGRKASVAVVRAGDRGLVLGVTEHQITVLAETTADELIEAPRTVSLDVEDDPSSDDPTWKSITEQLREKTVRRS